MITRIEAKPKSVIDGQAHYGAKIGAPQSPKPCYPVARYGQRHFQIQTFRELIDIGKHLDKIRNCSCICRFFQSSQETLASENCWLHSRLRSFVFGLYRTPRTTSL